MLRIGVALGDSDLVLWPVQKIRSFMVYWLPALVWMVVIYSASSDPKSFQHSSRIIEPILRWLFPHLSDQAVDGIVFAVRKCAHVTEYAILGLLFWRALRQPLRHESRPWRGSQARLAVLLVALYAASDELHQLFVPNRQASVLDVLLDTSGAAIGLLVFWGVGKALKRW